MNAKVPASLMWDKRPLTEVKENDYVPVNDFSLMVRTHASQVHDWLKEGYMSYKNGRNGNRPTKMIKVLPLSKMISLLKDCGMSNKKMAVFEAEGYATAPAKGKPGPKPKAKDKPGSKPYNKPGPKLGSKRVPKPKPIPAGGSSNVNQYIEQSDAHKLDIKTYVAIIDGAIEAGIVAAV
ncbi:MAG: hypothetical protein V3V74_07235 [Nitrosomonadaceae bacterium]